MTTGIKSTEQTIGTQPLLVKPVVIGSLVRFYDCQQADRDRDFSGTNLKYYPIGKVIDVYNFKSWFGYEDECCNIQIGERISKGHFTRCVNVVS
jgi:hypothetical protein